MPGQGPSRAPTPSTRSGPRRVAVVAGSNGPPGAGALRFAVADRDRMARTLSSRRCGFDVTQVDPEDSIDAFRNKVVSCAEDCHEGDTLLVSFAGHALLDQDELFLIWGTSRVERLLQTSMPAADIFRAMNRSAASDKLLVLDCCHAGAILGPGFRSTLGEDLSSVAPDESSFALLLASDRLELAREYGELRAGFLTHALCEAIELPADRDGDGQVSLSDAVGHIRMLAERRRAGPRPEDHQLRTPLVAGKSRGEVMLTATPPWRPFTFSLGPVEMTLLPAVRQGGLDALSRFPVTNRVYRRFVEATDHAPPVGEAFDADERRWVGPFHPWDDGRFNDPDQPVVCVSHRDARAFTRWMSQEVAGSRIRPSGAVRLDVRRRRWAVALPRDALWRFAALGEVRRYSLWHEARWDRIPLTPQPSLWPRSDRPGAIDRTGSRENGFGLVDMVGSIWEWCEDDVPDPRSMYSIKIALLAQPGIGDFGATPTLHGGSYLDEIDHIDLHLRASDLLEGVHTAHTDLGFRISTVVDTRSLPGGVVDLVRLHMYDRM